MKIFYTKISRITVNYVLLHHTYKSNFPYSPYTGPSIYKNDKGVYTRWKPVDIKVHILKGGVWDKNI